MLIIAFIQLILHYLGWLEIILAAIAFVFGNTIRAKELLISGIAFLALKYVIGIIYWLLKDGKPKEVKETS